MAEPRRFLVTRTPGFQVLFGALLGQAPSQVTPNQLFACGSLSRRGQPAEGSDFPTPDLRGRTMEFSILLGRV